MSDDDDFYSDGESKSKSHHGSLLPIVEVPSEGGDSAAPSTARTETPSTTRTLNDDQDYSDEFSQDDLSPGEEIDTAGPASNNNKKKKKKVRNGHNHVDMTPPDKLLKKSERKARKYAEKSKIDASIKEYVQCTALAHTMLIEIATMRIDASIKEYVRCTALARIVYGDGHWKLARTHSDLAAAYFDLKSYPAQAQYHSEIARGIMMSSVHLTTESTERHKILEVLINIHYTLGRAFTVTKKYSDGEQALFKAEKLAKERAKLHTVSDDSIENWQIKLYLAIARLCGKSGKQATATTYFDKALEVLRDRYGDDAVELVPVYQGLGKVEQSRGEHADHDKAIEYFTQAHSITAAAYRDGSEEIGDTARALATAYATVGETEAEISSESYLNEALVTYQKVHGPHHHKTVEVQEELARLMVRTDRQQEGLELLRSTMPDRHAVYGELSKETAETWKLIGSVHLAQQETEKALRAFKKCHNIECLVYGQNNKKSKDTQRTMDLLLANPHLASKHKRTKADELKERPRFNAMGSIKQPIGGFKAS